MKTLRNVNDKLVTKEEKIPKVPFNFRRIFASYSQPRYQGDGTWTFCDEGDLVLLSEVLAALKEFEAFLDAGEKD